MLDFRIRVYIVVQLFSLDSFFAKLALSASCHYSSSISAAPPTFYHTTRKTERQKRWHGFEKRTRKRFGVKRGEWILRFPPLRLYGALYMYGFKWTVKRICAKLKER